MAPGARIEVRIDSALFSDAMVTALDKRQIQFTISVPFERLPKLKHLIETRKRWWRHNSELFGPLKVPDSQLKSMN